MKTIALCIALLSGLVQLPALAADYIEGQDYYPCAEKATNPSGFMTYKTCEAPGTKASYNVAYTDEHGLSRSHMFYGTFFLRCDERNQCTVFASPTYTTGEFMGNAPTGNYKVSYGFYLDMDIEGNPVAYRMGRGPQYNEEPLGSTWGGDETPIAGGAWMEE